MHRKITVFIAAALSVIGCVTRQAETTGIRVAALDDALWQSAEWWADKIITPHRHDGMNGSRPAFRGVLRLTFADGSTPKKYAAGSHTVKLQLNK